MDRRFDGRGTLPARPIGRLSPSAVFPVGMAEKSFGCPTVRCPASFGHSQGAIAVVRLQPSRRYFSAGAEASPGICVHDQAWRSLFGFGIGFPCFPGYWNNAKMQRGPQDFRRHFSPAILFFPTPGGTFCPKDDEPISFCIIFSDAGRTIPVRIFLTCARRTDLLLSGAAGIGRIPVPAGRTLRPAPFLLLAGVFL